MSAIRNSLGSATTIYFEQWRFKQDIDLIRKHLAEGSAAGHLSPEENDAALAKIMVAWEYIDAAEQNLCRAGCAVLEAWFDTLHVDAARQQRIESARVNGS